MQLSINNVSMRLGAQILFEDVKATFASRPALGDYRPERSWQVHDEEDHDW